MMIGLSGLSVRSRAIFASFGMFLTASISTFASGESFGKAILMSFCVGDRVSVTLSSLILRDS